MRHLRWMLMAVGLGLLAGCGSEKPPEGTGEITTVWTGEGYPWKSIETPPGFKVSPSEAYDKVFQSGRLSRKHNWACFRDARYYYIYDTFGARVNGQTAVKQGVRVDGVTGKVK